MLGINYGPDDDPLAILQQRDRGAISVYAQGDDYHDVIKPRLKALARWLIAQCRRRREGVRRYRRGDGKAAGRGAPVSAGRASTPIWCRANSAPGCFSARSSPRSNCRADAPETDQLRHLPRLPRHLPDRGVSRALPARCAALHFLSHHRAQGPDPARAARRRWATASMAATIAWRSVRGTSSRRPAARRSSRARELARAAARRSRPPRRRAFRALFSKIAGQAHRPRSLRAQRADRDRQFRRCGARGRSRALARRCIAAGARRRRVGAVEAIAAAKSLQRWRNATAIPTQTVQEEWTRRSPRIPSPPRSAARCPPAATVDDRRP